VLYQQGLQPTSMVSSQSLLTNQSLQVGNEKCEFTLFMTTKAASENTHKTWQNCFRNDRNL